MLRHGWCIASQVTILVDVAERRSPVPTHLETLGVHVEMAVLPAGDYDVGNAVIERKTIPDLHRSIANRRLWDQVGALSRGSPRGYLIIEGANLDAGALGSHGVRGAVLQVIDNGVAVVRTAVRPTPRYGCDCWPCAVPAKTPRVDGAGAAGRLSRPAGCSRPFRASARFWPSASLRVSAPSQALRRRRHRISWRSTASGPNVPVRFAWSF